MQTELTQFSSWLTCQYPHSSARKHTMSDLALFFSWAEKPPSAISPHDVDGYIQHCLSKGLSPLTINRRLSSLRLFYYFLSVVNEEAVECPVISKRHFLCNPHPLVSLPRGIRSTAPVFEVTLTHRFQRIAEEVFGCYESLCDTSQPIGVGLSTSIRLPVSRSYPLKLTCPLGVISCL